MFSIQQVLDSSIKEDIVLQQPTDREVYEYELQIPGYQAEVKRQSGLYLSGREDNQRCEVSSGDAINGRCCRGNQFPDHIGTSGRRWKNNPDRKTR